MDSADTLAHPLPASATGAGALLREWRARRRLSQLELALDVGVSPRHLSFVETGRARPSAEMLLALADRLPVPLRERNRMLLAAGHAPRYSHRRLDDAGLRSATTALQRLLDAHHPYPGIILDRQWNVVQTNRAAGMLKALLPEHLRQPTLNMFRASLDPRGFAAYTTNFDDWGSYLLEILSRTIGATGDPGLMALEREALALPNVRALLARRRRNVSPAPALLVPCVLELPGVGRLSLFTTLTTFGTPCDVTLEEVCAELFYPLDAETDARLRAVADALPAT